MARSIGTSYNEEDVMMDEIAGFYDEKDFGTGQDADDMRKDEEFDDDDNELTYEDMRCKNELLNFRNPLLMNERLQYDGEEDPLDYEWPFTFNNFGEKFLLSYENIDSELRRDWEDEYFDVVTEERIFEPDAIRGGDWANNRVSRGIPPRIKRYYANLLEFRLRNDSSNAILCYEKMLGDHYVNRSFVPYGVYHEMQNIYFKERAYADSIAMFREIVTRYNARPCDVSVAMESFVKLGDCREALRVWDSLRLKPGFEPDDSCWISLIRAHASILDFATCQEIFESALLKAKTQDSKLTISNIMSLMMGIYAQYGWKDEFFELLNDEEEQFERRFNSNEMQIIFVGLCQLKCYEEALEWHEKFISAGMSENKDTLMARLEVNCAKRDFEAVVATFEDFDENEIFKCSECYSLIIKHENDFGATQWYKENIEESGKNMEAFAPTHRNFRNIFAARMLSGKVEANDIFSMLEFLNEKKISIDSTFMEAYVLSATKVNEYDKALEFFANTASQGIIPSIQFLIELLKTAPNKDRMLPCYLWQVVKEYEIAPTYELANAIVRHVAPERNVLGRQQMRLGWMRWTKSPTSMRTLTRLEYEEFDKFVVELSKSLPQENLDDVYHPLYKFQVHAVMMDQEPIPPTPSSSTKYKLAALPFETAPKPTKQLKKRSLLPKLSQIDQIEIEDILN